MPSTVLAVEDSVTMRRVLEITFAGPDFNVVTVDSADAALQKLKSIKADVVVADVTLEQKSGYDLCKAIKQSTPGVPVLILSSKQNPFDPARGSAAQADDHIDKPFDTQQMIDKVKKLLGGGKADALPAAGATAPVRSAPNPLASTMQGQVAPAPNRTMPSASGTAPAVAQPLAGQPQQRAKTLVYNPGVAMPPIAAAQPARALAPSGRIPAVTPTAAASGARPTSVSGSSAATSPSLTALPGQASQAHASGSDGTAAHINGQMTAKLEELGLTAHQIEAVVALSREVVERVVWEVVPVLAETIIKEELARIVK